MLNSKSLANFLLGSLLLGGLSIASALFSERVLADIKCPKKIFGRTQEFCPHVHPRDIFKPGAESDIPTQMPNPPAKPSPPVYIPPHSQVCPPTFSPSTFQGRTGRIAFYNEWNAPVTVIIYHPNSKSVYNRYAVSSGQNQILGNNIIVGDDWGICFENNPGSSGFMNNLGVISDYNPNFQGSPLFMIQNNRIR